MLPGNILNLEEVYKRVLYLFVRPNHGFFLLHYDKLMNYSDKEALHVNKSTFYKSIST